LWEERCKWEAQLLVSGLAEHFGKNNNMTISRIKKSMQFIKENGLMFIGVVMLLSVSDIVILL
jgi:hypothetical protein